MQQLTDHIIPFMVKDLTLRGRMVCLESVLNQIITQHTYPKPISLLLAEALTAIALLSDMLKSQSLMTLQIRLENNPLQALIVDYRPGGSLRGCVVFDREALQEAYADIESMEDYRPLITAQGYCSLTIDPQSEKERYQAIVSLEGQTISQMLMYYFKQSEQLDTLIHLAVQPPFFDKRTNRNESLWRSSGFLVQHLARDGGVPESVTTENPWEEAEYLFQTVRSDEMLDPELSPEGLLMRLFHAYDVQLFPYKELKHQCSCSRERAMGALMHLSQEERVNYLMESGMLEVICQFCSKKELFDPINIQN